MYAGSREASGGSESFNKPNEHGTNKRRETETITPEERIKGSDTYIMEVIRKVIESRGVPCGAGAPNDGVEHRRGEQE